MCNLYSITTNQEAIRAPTKAIDRLGNLEPRLPSIQTRWRRPSATLAASAKQ